MRYFLMGLVLMQMLQFWIYMGVKKIYPRLLLTTC